MFLAISDCRDFYFLDGQLEQPRGVLIAIATACEKPRSLDRQNICAVGAVVGAADPERAAIFFTVEFQRVFGGFSIQPLFIQNY